MNVCYLIVITCKLLLLIGMRWCCLLFVVISGLLRVVSCVLCFESLCLLIGVVWWLCVVCCLLCVVCCVLIDV